jgi:hypothetical protein
MIPIDQIKSLMKSGDIAGAEALCKQALETHPDDVWLKRRYGMCRRLQGDEETFRRINDEISEMEKMERKKESLRDMYYHLWLALFVVALVIGGAVAFKYVMLGVLVLAAIIEITVYLRPPPSVLREYVMIGVVLGAAMAGMFVYFGRQVGKRFKWAAHTDDPAPDVVLEVETAGTNIVESAMTNSAGGPIEQPSQTESETP